MPERLQIIYMQVRLVRLASEKWHKTIQEINLLFQQYTIYQYVSDFWDLFHIESDDAVLEDIRDHLIAKGAEI